MYPLIALKEVVITGGAGFIGSNLAERLVLDGHHVTILDDLSTGSRMNIQHLIGKENVGFLQGSILDRSLLTDAFKGVECVFHQAARPSVLRSVQDPFSTNETNITGTLNVLVAAKDMGVEKVVVASSSSVYGDTPTLPKQEDMPSNPRSPYAVSKLAGEHYCRVFSDMFGLRTTCLRYFNVYGPRQNPASDYAAVIPRFISSALNKEAPLIYGDGTQTRDFTFVQDVVKANILAMEVDAPGVFNIASGRRVSIDELARMLLKMGDVDLEPVKGAARPGDVKHSLADITAARDRLGYRPDYSLEKGLEVTLKWYSSLR